MDQADGRGVVHGDGRVLEHSSPQDRKSQPGVVGPGVVVDESGNETVRAQSREVRGELLSGDATVALADAPAAGEVVHPQSGRVAPCGGPVNGSSIAEQGNEERKGLDEVRCVLEQETAFGEALADEAEVMLLEVAQAPVHHLGRLGGRAGRKVAPFHESGSQPPRGRVQRDTGPGDPSPHDDDVVAFACKPGQSDVTVENGRWAFHQGTVATACHKPTAGPKRLTAPRPRRVVPPHGPRAGQFAVVHEISRSRAHFPVKLETSTAEDLKNN